MLCAAGGAADGAVRVGGRQGPSPEDGARGGERSSAEFHGDEDRCDSQRASLEDDAGAPFERRSRAGNSPLRSGNAQAALEGGAGLFFGLRDIPGGRSPRGGQDRLPQSLRIRPTPRKKIPLIEGKRERPQEKKISTLQKIFSEKFFFLKRGIIIAPHG